MAEPSLFQRIHNLGISRGHASDVASGVKPPSLKLAIRIYRQIGIKLGPIAHATPREINAMEKFGVKRVAQ